MSQESPVIDHNPNERREPRWMWKAIFVGIAFLWIINYPKGYNWTQIALGGISGLFLAAWAMERTGGVVPESWRTKPTRRR